MNQIIVTTFYSFETDTIVAEIAHAATPQRVFAKLMIAHPDLNMNSTVITITSTDNTPDPEDHLTQFEQLQDGLNELPMMNLAHLAAVVLNALADATTEDTEIPMCPDESVTIDV